MSGSISFIRLTVGFVQVVMKYIDSICISFIRLTVGFVQVVMKYVEMLDYSSEFVTSLLTKLAPPLVTLLSTEPEIQYVALRNINIIVQKR